MAAPKWAQDLVLKVALDHDRDTLPELRWRRSRWTTLSSGHTTPPHDGTKADHGWPRDGRIVVTAGKERRDQKLVLLHEIAHWLSPVGEHHGAAFWDLAWRLYRRYGVPLRYAKQRERVYRKGSVAAYARTRGGRERRPHGTASL